MPSFQQVLRAVAEAYRGRREQVDDQAERLTAMLRRSASLQADGGELGADILEEALGQMRQYFDDEDGGFGSQPKFPQPMTLDFALMQYVRTGDLDALSMAELTLEDGPAASRSTGRRLSSLQCGRPLAGSPF
jgi:hypothetical protein